jgi:hypothetical protein
MPRTSNVHARSGILSAAVIVLASSWAIGSPASAAEPAKVVIPYGEVAALLQLQYHPAQPVLRAGAGDNVVAILFDEDPNRAAAEAPAQGGALWLTSSIIRRAVLRPNPSIIPARHRCPTPPPPNTQSAAPAGCQTVTNQRTCSRRLAHWYTYNTTTALWVYQTTTCGPCPSPPPC